MPDVGNAVWSAWQRVKVGVLRVNQWGCAPGHWPSERAATRFNASLIVLWSAFCSSILLRTGHFTYDQAYFYEQSVRVADTFRWPAYGPFVSGITPSPLTPGGMLFVVLSVPFFAFRDPRIGVIWIHLLVATGAWLFDRALKKLAVAAPIRVATLALYVMSVAHARAEETFWNGDLFLFITPALLFLAATMISDRERLWPHAAFGAVSALSLQTHLSGGMGIMLCLSIVLLMRPAALRPKASAVIALAAAACYLPYVLHEASTGFPNTQLLRSAVPSGTEYSREAMLRSLLVPVMYVAHVEHPAQLVDFSSHDWVNWAAVFSGWVAVLLCIVGTGVRNSLKLWSFVVVLALPIYFRLTGRGYQDHDSVRVSDSGQRPRLVSLARLALANPSHRLPCALRWRGRCDPLHAAASTGAQPSQPLEWTNRRGAAGAHARRPRSRQSGSF
jgi:hypothetical protein